MNAPSPPGASTPGGVAVRTLRYLVRGPLLLWHMLVHLPLVVLTLALPSRPVGTGGESPRHRAIRAWSAGLMWIFGFRLQRVGTPLPGATLFVANHVSWIDITALHSQRMMGFVAKREIRDWPVIGWLADRAETIFHSRGSTASLGGVVDTMLKRLREGRSVGVFPEAGATGGGHVVGPFHARIFMASVEAGVPVQPVALVYGACGAAQPVVAFGPDETFLGNFVRLLGEPPRTATLHFLEPIAHGDADGRRRIAELARGRIVAAFGARVPGPGVSAAAAVVDPEACA